jgi:DNA-directed RNA polymerase subunit RPC12/RpoP
MPNPFVYEEDEEFPEDEEIRCKYCHERYLHWEEARGERNQKVFVLMNEDGSIHHCPAFAKASVNEFEDF